MAFEVENLAFRAERRGHINQPILTGRDWRDDIRGTVEKMTGRRRGLDLMVSFVESAGVHCLSAGCSWRRRDDGKTLCQWPWACA